VAFLFAAYDKPHLVPEKDSPATNTKAVCLTEIARLTINHSFIGHSPSGFFFVTLNHGHQGANNN
jgi:hypothetical protein